MEDYKKYPGRRQTQTRCWECIFLFGHRAGFGVPREITSEGLTEREDAQRTWRVMIHGGRRWKINGQEEKGKDRRGRKYIIQVVKSRGGGTADVLGPSVFQSPVLGRAPAAETQARQGRARQQSRARMRLVLMVAEK